MRLREREEGERRRRLLREQPLSRLFPNLITMAGLCCGLSAVRFAMDGKWEISVGFILAAALIDGMDGRIARLLGATSVFGAQLDSLSDFLCFGVAPVLVLYHFQLHEVRGIGWAVVLFYAVCCALRLARFNTGLVSQTQEPWQKKFFTGVPSPAGGVLVLWPLFVFLLSEHTLKLPVFYVVLHVFFIAVLMASRIPTFAAKNVRIKTELIVPVMVTAALYVAMLLIEPWFTIVLSSVVYIAAIPLSVSHYRKLQRSHVRAQQVDLHAA